MKKIYIILFFSLVNTIFLVAQKNDNISLQGKSVMYRLGGKLFYGRALNRQIPIEQKIVESTDSSALMKVSAKDAFGKIGERNLKPEKQDLAVVEAEQAVMKVRSKDAFGNYVYENINPIAEQKVVLMDENETVMRITVTDAFGNFSFENLNPEGNYKIQLQMESDPNLPKEDMIYLTNKDNIVLETFKVNESGKFNYSLLSGEKTKMELMEAVEVKMQEGK